MMSQRSKRELAGTIQPRYLKASKKEKSKILDEFVAATGYHRKYAINLLKHGLRRRHRKKAGRKKKYTWEVVKVLEQIWEICGRICSKRLHPFLPEITEVLERHGEQRLSQDTRALLLSMSRSTVDRCLQKARYEKKKEVFQQPNPAPSSKNLSQCAHGTTGMMPSQGLWKWI